MDPLTLALLSGGVGAVGNLTNPPKRTTLDIPGILARMSERENRYVNNIVGRQASVAGQNMAAQGITGPAVGQVIGGIEAPIRAASLGRMQDKEAELRERQTILDADFKAKKGNWWNTLFGDLARTGGAAAGAMNTNKLMDKMSQLDEFHLQRLRELLLSDTRPATQVTMNSSGPATSGTNAQSFLDFLSMSPRGMSQRP